MKKYQGIIFDFNGVLLWDSPIQEKSWLELSKKLRDHPLTPREMINIVHGRTNKYIMEYLAQRTIPEDELQELIKAKESYYQELCLAESDSFQLSPGAIPLLDFLVENNIPHTIATSSEKFNLDFFIQHLNLKQWFDVAKIAYDDGNISSKPAPDIYIKAANNISVEPINCIVVEDAISGIMAAQKASIGKIYALGPIEKHALLKSTDGADEVITTLNEIPKEIFTIN